ncbi:hypothetical protein BBO_04588 [Beauveria brongniartii RCEF 3172]|uniref:C2H2-type domain-containing protein n=1 Tax=Beauveria brongniartii RCEF 3172 TaxID=1081107 RepID=A0A162HUE3_9HYPO|nr:hypothetical protein BBO_04588 [Beauveria brongniartii RCEF 3172]
MSHIAPRPSQRPAHRQTLGSNPQTLDPRLELVGKLEGCIGKVLEAANAYKSPQQQQQQQQQQHTAHQNANQMFQQRVMASSRGQMGNMSDQDWLGTMMQCLNESMRTQQSSFVRNTTLDVALRTFAAGIFEALGPAYFQEPLDKYMAASKPDSPQNIIAAYDALGRSGIPSPPRETGPNRSILQRLGTQNIPPPSSPTHSSPFPFSHYQIVHRSAHSVSPDGAPAQHQHQMRTMPILQRPLPPAHQPGRPPKRPSPTEPLNPLAQKRTYASKALRQAAGSMGPLLSPAQARPSHSNALKPRLCIDFWDVQQERDSRRRQAILGYGGKWYVFQCHRHQDILLFKTAEGARHHMITRHAMPNQHIDFLDIVQELGVEVMNCDVARAEKNNLEAVHLWNQSASSPVAQEGAAEVRVNAKISVREPISITTQTVPAADCLLSASPASASLPTAQLESPSLVLPSEDEAGKEESAQKAHVIIIKKEEVDVGFSSLAAEVQPHPLITTPRACSTQSSEPVSLLKESQGPLSHKATRTVQSPERDEPVISPEESARRISVVSSTAKAAPATPENLEHVPELTPNSPESSDLSEPSSLADFDSLEKQSIGSDPKVIIDGELEEGEIDESCIRVAPCSAAMSAKMMASPESSGNKKKRGGISAAAAAADAAGSVPCSGLPRKKLPSTPKSAQKQKKRKRQSFWSPSSQETGPSAHDQFKTRACKKCAERFYFRAQLATHMQTEHCEIITVE